MAESLVRFAQWKYHQKTDIKEEITHGQVVDLLSYPLRSPCQKQGLNPSIF